MHPADVVLNLLIPTLILLHLVVAPYTKVEESFNIQATHNILEHGVPIRDVSHHLQTHFDHVQFPGAVPRTFLGSVVLAGLSQPFIALAGAQYAQHIVRAVLGMFNALALLHYKSMVQKAFDVITARWFVLFLAGQFHVLFYASRTLPNMFAFGLSTLALAQLLPVPPSGSDGPNIARRRHRVGVFFLVFAGVVFRSELAILLATQLLYLLATTSTPLTIRSLIPLGIGVASLALILSVPLDSLLWQRPIWPELSGFIYNAIEGKSSDWGTSPFHAYFTNFLVKLLLNPTIFILGIPLAIAFPSSRNAALGLLVPSLAFITIYSVQPHKEARFIIYVVPPLTACASIGASYVTIHRGIICRILLIIFGVSIPLSFVVSTSMLLISSLNYPGGSALYALQAHISKTASTSPINVHMDVLSCMTGVTLFQQDHATPPLYTSIEKLIIPQPAPANTAPQIIYSKAEDPSQLLRPEFWQHFDYVLTSTPEKVIGKWNVIETIYAYAGIEFLRPGQAAKDTLPVHAKEYSEVADVDVNDLNAKDEAPEGAYDETYVAVEETDDAGNVFEDDNVETVSVSNAQAKRNSAALARLFDRAKELGYYGMIREGMRSVTGSWWIGPRMEAKIWILKRNTGGIKGSWGYS